MVKIILKEGEIKYFIEIDSMNYTLCRSQTIINSSGLPQERKRVLGYFSSLQHAVERFLLWYQLDKTEGWIVDLKGYVELVKMLNESAIREIESTLKRHLEENHEYRRLSNGKSR